jgi:RimJ/RimL family protein N-acetyltransferase
VIAGDRVVLRARRESDVPYARRWYGDPETTRWLLRPYPAGEDVYEVPAEPLSFGQVLLTVDDAETGTPIGTAGLLDGSPEHRRATAFVTIGDSAFRGRGYGTDTVRTLCRYAFDAMNLAKVELEVLADNASALATYERLGFVREVHRRRALWVDGAWRDELLMGLLPGELR